MSTPETRARKVALLLHHYVGIRAEGMILAGAIWCLVGLRAVLTFWAYSETATTYANTASSPLPPVDRVVVRRSP